MSRKGVFYIGFFIALIIAFYFFLTALIPDFGKKKVTVVSTVKPFSFTNQDGKPFTEQDMKGKVCVVEFFFTSCPGICPIMNGNMKKVYESFRNEKDFLIISHTSDPETDSAATLKAYSNKLGVSNDKWVFVTGRKDSLYSAARISYVIDDPNHSLIDIKEQFIHSQNWSLVDKAGRVRGIYDGLKEDEIAKMTNEIKELLKE